MKTLISVFIFSLACEQVSAQKNFEGRIVYETSIPSKGKINSEIHFGNEKVKIADSVNLFPNSLNHVSIIDFNKGLVYMLSHDTRTYYDHLLKAQPSSITITLKPFPEKNRKILGYNCSAFKVEEYTKYIPEMSFYFWYADSLFYQTDKKYKNSFTAKVTNGLNIFMGMEMIPGTDSSQSRFMIPVSIIAEQVPDSIFSIPVRYKKVTEMQFFKGVFDQFQLPQAPPSNITVTAPPSTPFRPDPDKSITISLEKEEKVFLTMGSKIRKMEILYDLNKSKALGLDTSELLKLGNLASIGIPFIKLKLMLHSPSAIVPEQMEGIPVKDSTTNEMTDWLRSIVNVYQNDDTIKLEEIILIKGNPDIVYPDFKNIKFALKKNGVYKFRMVTNND